MTQPTLEKLNIRYVDKGMNSYCADRGLIKNQYRTCTVTLNVMGLSGMEPFFVEYEDNYIHGNTFGVEAECVPAILFLHGGEKSDDRNVFLLLRQTLLNRYAITSCAFDCIGHGTTGGKQEDSSLSSRTEQAANIVNACFDSQPFTVVACDMGAYTALKLTQLFPIESLVLINPKVYALEVYNDLLGSSGECLSHFPQHWENTDAWSIIDRFKGRVSIVGTNKDDPWCPGTMSRLYSHSTRAKSRQAFDIK